MFAASNRSTIFSSSAGQRLHRNSVSTVGNYCPHFRATSVDTVRTPPEQSTMRDDFDDDRQSIFPGMTEDPGEAPKRAPRPLAEKKNVSANKAKMEKGTFGRAQRAGVHPLQPPSEAVHSLLAQDPRMPSTLAANIHEFLSALDREWTNLRLRAQWLVATYRAERTSAVKRAQRLGDLRAWSKLRLALVVHPKRVHTDRIKALDWYADERASKAYESAGRTVRTLPKYVTRTRGQRFYDMGLLKEHATQYDRDMVRWAEREAGLIRDDDARVAALRKKMRAALATREIEERVAAGLDWPDSAVLQTRDRQDRRATPRDAVGPESASYGQKKQPGVSPQHTARGSAQEALAPRPPVRSTFTAIIDAFLAVLEQELADLRGRAEWVAATYAAERTAAVKRARRAGDVAAWSNLRLALTFYPKREHPNRLQSLHWYADYPAYEARESKGKTIRATSTCLHREEDHCFFDMRVLAEHVTQYDRDLVKWAERKAGLIRDDAARLWDLRTMLLKQRAGRPKVESVAAALDWPVGKPVPQRKRPGRPAAASGRTTGRG